MTRSELSFCGCVGHLSVAHFDSGVQLIGIPLIDLSAAVDSAYLLNAGKARAFRKAQCDDTRRALRGHPFDLKTLKMLVRLA